MLPAYGSRELYTVNRARRTLIIYYTTQCFNKLNIMLSYNNFKNCADIFLQFCINVFKRNGIISVQSSMQ